MEGLLTFSFIITAGFLPAFIWLWFILKEDRPHPEPRLRLTMAFISGMLAVVAVLPLQAFFQNRGISAVFVIILFAGFEELFKFLFAYLGALRSKDADEPMDEVIYMATAALGFAALENCLFLARPFIEGDISHALAIAHARFLGSTLIHVTCSSIIGMYMAKYFYNKKNKWEAIGLGLIFAIGLHSIYNFFIMNPSITSVLNIFIGLWVICIILVLVLNHIKKHFTYEQR